MNFFRSTRGVDLNADLGEGVTDDAGLLAVVTSANVACGYHAGDEATMAAVCREAARRGVRVGAQVSYLDREGFGRRPMSPPAAELTEWVANQLSLLRFHAERAGTRVSYVKPHGALYNRVVVDADQAAAVLAGIDDLPVLGLPGGELVRQAVAQGRRVVLEGFPDRGYTAEGRLIPRDQPGALIESAAEVAAHAVRLADSASVETVCVHGDSPDAVQTAHAVRAALEAAGWQVRPWPDIPTSGPDNG